MGCPGSSTHQKMPHTPQNRPRAEASPNIASGRPRCKARRTAYQPSQTEISACQASPVQEICSGKASYMVCTSTPSASQPNSAPPRYTPQICRTRKVCSAAKYASPIKAYASQVTSQFENESSGRGRAQNINSE